MSALDNLGSTLSATPADQLAATVYGHLRAIAQRQMNEERAGHTLSATALVHEAFLRLEGHSAAPGWMGGATAEMRLRFLRSAAEAMRRILIEHARARDRIKRGGGKPGLTGIDLNSIGDVADLSLSASLETAEAFDNTFAALDEHNPRLADVVRLRFFTGLSVAETAHALGVSERTVNNDWAYARAWLALHLGRRGAP